MKVILLDNVEGLGNIGSEVVVKSGYGRNFLIPQSKALLATKKNRDFFNKSQLVLQSKISEKELKAKLCVKAINQLGSITIKVRSSIQGKLFGSVGSRQIAKVIEESVGFKVLKSQVRLPDNDSLKSIGTYSIRIHMYNEIFANLDVIIVDTLS